MRHVVYDLAEATTWAAWAAVGIGWAVGAVLGRGASHVRERRGRDGASRAAFAIGAAIALTPESFWRALTVGSNWSRLAGVAVLALACLLTLWARLALGMMWSSAVTARRNHVLRTTGPYAVTRHPIYTGTIAMLIGTALAQGLGRWAAILVVVTVMLEVKMRAEERLLVEEFPARYERYRREVPQLIPGLRAAGIRRMGAQAAARSKTDSSPGGD